MKELICICCPQGCRLRVDEEADYAVSGHRCQRGEDYGREEMQNPTRVLTSSVRVEGSHIARCPVRTNRPIPKALLFQAMELVRAACVSAPVQTGQVIISDILGTGADLVATRDLERI